MSNRNDSVTDLAGWLAQQVQQGRLTLGQVAGLTAEETAAVSDLARNLRRAGRLTEAAEVQGLLLVFDPYEARHWRAMAGIQRRLGNPGYAAICLEVVTFLDGPDEEISRRQVRCLRQIGAAELAEQVAGGVS